MSVQILTMTSITPNPMKEYVNLSLASILGISDVNNSLPNKNNSGIQSNKAQISGTLDHAIAARISIEEAAPPIPVQRSSAAPIYKLIIPPMGPAIAAMPNIVTKSSVSPVLLILARSSPVEKPERAANNRTDRVGFENTISLIVSRGLVQKDVHGFICVSFG